jgi:hypothetical protein
VIAPDPAVIDARIDSLRARSDTLRAQFAQDSTVLARPLSLADSVMGGVNQVRSHPEWVLGAFALLAILKPRRVLRWTSRAWGTWHLARRVGRVVSALAETRR